jgi:amino acid adenylation domain-containing protein/non-ribosomal peptide synthase protein (TIGR01720 family)
MDKKLKDLNEHIEGLSPRKRALFELLMKEKQKAAAPRSIPKRPPGSSAPLSFAQQRLWFLDQWKPGTTAYNVAVAYRVKGHLDISILEKSISEVSRRHESLRTTFVALGEQAVQQIAPPQSVALHRVNLRNVLQSDCESHALELITAAARQPFDLARGPLFGATIFELGTEDHILFFSMHHIISDGWSVGVMMRELMSIYHSSLKGEPSSLDELSVQYPDFAVWQREQLNDGVLRQQLNYWKEQLKEAPRILELPGDWPRPAVQSFEGAHLYVALNEALTTSLKKLSEQSGATLFMTVLAGFGTLLKRYTGQDDIIVGSALAGRNHTEVEGLIGFFTNMLALRLSMSDDPSFRALLDRVREMTLAAHANQDLPFERLVEELGVERDLSRTPLFQIVFALHNAPTESLSNDDLTLSPIPIDNGASKFDLALEMIEQNGELVCSFEYNTDLFSPDTIQRFATHFETLLTAICEQPESSLSSLPLLSQNELQEQLISWNNTHSEFRRDVCIHELFEEQVVRDPAAVAVVCGEEQLTYGEINQRANRLAHYLRRLGVTTETLVGVCVERSAELVTALLAVLKAGGAYVPLDPTYPPDRLAFLLDDASAPVLLTQERLLNNLNGSSAVKVCLDRDWGTIEKESAQELKGCAEASNLAYAIYTSGSTGKPKGVLVEHRSLNNLCTWHQRTYNIQPQDRATQVASLAFDASVWELWPYLTSGAAIYIPDEETRVGAPQLLNWLERNKITISFLPTPLAEAVLQQPMPPTLSLRALLTGGDRLHSVTRPDLQFQLINHYGPTENTVVATACVVDTSESRSAPPIGRPIANTRVYILDQQLKPVPIGVAGELYIGGESLARGYLTRPELTGEKFISDPFNAGELLYKTGDLVRYLSTGDIEFLGRTDEQVKVRGYRIETGEIEATLCEHESVREACVVAREDEPGEKKLVAYVVTVNGSEANGSTSSELRRHLSQRLPQYMVPHGFVFLDALPLSPHGKVDRRLLPAPDASLRSSHDREFVSARTPAEELLVRIWGDVLKLETVGVHDNFFNLGGDSILSIQITARATQAGLRLTPMQLFQHQTIAELAAVGNNGMKFNSEQGEVTGPVPLTPIQNWFFEQDLAEPHHFNQAITLQLTEPVDLSVLERSVEQLLSHHDALRMRFEKTSNGWTQTNCSLAEIANGPSAFVHFDFSEQTVEEQFTAISRAVAELHESFDLSRPPLVRAALFTLGGRQPDRLSMIVHHLLVDGVSWRILVEDFQTIYDALTNGAVVALSNKTTSFKTWAHDLERYASSEEIQGEANYWLGVSQQSPTLLPVDIEGGVNTVASVRVVNVTLDSDETQLLLHTVPATYRTQMNDVLLAGLLQAFHDWTGWKGLSLHLEAHGREEIIRGADLTRTVGWFTTIFPVHLEIEGNVEPGVLLNSVKEQLRRIPNRGIGYGVLRCFNDELSRKLQDHQSPQVSFNYLGQFNQLTTNRSLFRLWSGTNETDHALQGSSGPNNTRPHLIDVVVIVTDKQLHISFGYSENIHRRETIEHFAKTYVDRLRSIIKHCQSPEAGSVEVSDFVAARLSQKELKKLMSRINRVVSEDV